MIKNRIFKVTNGRMLYKCAACNAKRMVAVPPNVRFRSVHCHKCATITRCSLDRRQTRREQQLGKILALFPDGSFFEVQLADISLNGIGLDIGYRDIKKFQVGREIRFQCNWNPQFIGMNRYRLRSAAGRGRN